MQSEIEISYYIKHSARIELRRRRMKLPKRQPQAENPAKQNFWNTEEERWKMKGNTVWKGMLRTIFREKTLSFGIIATVIGAVSFSLLPPLILGQIVDQIASGRMVSAFYLSSYITVIFLTGIFESAREGLLTVFGQKITHTLRSELSEKLVRLDADTLGKEEPGAVVSRMVGDVDTIEKLFTSGIISMVTDICRIVTIFMIIWTKNIGLAVMLLFLIPFVYFFTRNVQRRMLSAQIQNRRAVGRASGQVPETIHNIRTIHMLGKECYMENRYDACIGESYAAMEKTNFCDAVYSPVILCLNAVVTAAAMLLAASGNKKLLAWFGMSVGTSVTVIHYIAQIFSPIESLGMEIQTIQSAVAGVHRIYEFLSKPEKMTAKAEITKHEYLESEENVCVEFRDVGFGYEEHAVLHDLAFRIAQGEQVTLTGRTGAGKSTVFKLILGLYPSNSGEVLVCGKPAAQIPDSEKRKLFGYVEQSFHMVPGTVRDQITLFDPKIGEEQVIRAAKTAGLHEIICGLEQGYDTVCRPELLSQGQWQLLSIARAVAGEPKILLLDEITANLDAETELLVLDALKSASEGRTVISISHRVYQKKTTQDIRYLTIG